MEAEARSSWDREYQRGRYRHQPPVPFAHDVARRAVEAGLSGRPALYVGCGNGRNIEPLVTQAWTCTASTSHRRPSNRPVSATPTRPSSSGSAPSTAWAIVCAFTASQLQIRSIPAELSKRVALHEQAFDRAVGNLKKSRWLAAAAVVLLIAAVAVLWYAPRTPTETQESSPATGRSSLGQYRTADPIDGVRPPLRT